MKYYFPSCNFNQLFKELNMNIKNYLKVHSVQTLGCCRLDNKIPKKEDLVLTICTNCNLVLKEICQGEVVFLWEHLNKDETFLLPDFTGDHFIIQHCAKADNNQKEAVCNLIHKTGASYSVSEFDHFCGYNFMRHMSQANLKIAPVIFSELENQVTVLDKNQQEKKINNMVKSYQQEKVIVYCNSCYKTLKNKGVNVFHLAELMFRENKIFEQLNDYGDV